MAKKNKPEAEAPKPVVIQEEVSSPPAETSVEVPAALPPVEAEPAPEAEATPPVVELLLEVSAVPNGDPLPVFEEAEAGTLKEADGTGEPFEPMAHPLFDTTALAEEFEDFTLDHEAHIDMLLASKGMARKIADMPANSATRITAELEDGATQKLLISYPEGYKGRRGYLEGQEVCVSVESAAIFIRKGIATAID